MHLTRKKLTEAALTIVIIQGQQKEAEVLAWRILFLLKTKNEKPIIPKRNRVELYLRQLFPRNQKIFL